MDKGAGLRVLSLSGCEGSNPFPRIQSHPVAFPLQYTHPDRDRKMHMET